jgi:hypothetical protein
MTRAKLGGFGLLAVLAACEVASQAEVRDLAPSALGGFSQSADPSLGVDPSTGDVLLSWVAETDGEWNLYFARSGDGGATFSEPVQVNAIEGAVHPHAEGAPRLVAAPGVAAVFWNNTVEAPMRVWGAQDLLVSRTTDGGLTWEPAHPVHDDTLAAIPGEHTFHGATWAGESTLVVAWLDGRERDVRHIERAVASGVPREQAKLNPDAYALESEPTDSDATIFSAVSHDLGRTWEDANRRVMGGACPCCRVQLAGTPAGDIVGVWRQHFGDNVRDPALTSLFDEGAEPIRVHADNWTSQAARTRARASTWARTVRSTWCGSRARRGAWACTTPARLRAPRRSSRPCRSPSARRCRQQKVCITARHNRFVLAVKVTYPPRRHGERGRNRVCAVDPQGSVDILQQDPDLAS